MKSQYPIILSFDIEDWHQSTWDRNLPISEVSYDNTSRLLDILLENQVTATMFVLGKFAEKYPNLVKRMDEEGHEVACHGFDHIEIFKQTKNEFKDDVYKSKSLLEEIIGKPVIGYRAPDFSIVDDTLWALDILSNLDFKYDSSIFPIKHNRYGISNWPTYISKVKIDESFSILEFPLSTISVTSINLPISGGGYFRLIPKLLFSFLAKKVLTEKPFVFYGHPYELNPDEFKETKLAIPLSYKLHQSLGRRFVVKRLKNLFEKFPITNFSRYINDNSEKFPIYSLD